MGDFFRSLEHRKEWWVILQSSSMIDWTSGTGKRSGILNATAFFAFAVRLWASSVKDSKKGSVSATLLALMPLERSIRLANGNGLSDKSSISWNLTSKSFSPSETSRALTQDLTRISISGSGHVLPKVMVFKSYLSPAGQS